MARAAAAQRRHSFVWLQGLACGAVVTLAPGTALMLAVLLWPAGLAFFLDRAPGRPVARAVTLCAAAGCVDPLRALWTAGHSTQVSMALLSDLSVVGTAWSAAAAGWLLVELAPIVVRVALEARSHARAARLRSARARLAQEWGADDAAQPR